MTDSIVAVDPQALVRKAMAMIEANPNHWDQSEWHCGSSHCFFGFVEVAWFKADPTQEFTDDTTSTRAFVRELLGLTSRVTDAWSDVNNRLSMLQDIERLFCDDLASIDLDRYDPEALLIIASRPDLTPEVGTQLLEMVEKDGYSDEPVIEVLAMNSRTPVETLEAIARTCSQDQLVMLRYNPSIDSSSETLDRVRSAVMLNSRGSGRRSAVFFPI